MGEAIINDMHSTVRAVDGNSLLSPHTMDKIVQTVMAAVNDQESHRKRVRAEQRITNGVSHELEEQE